MKILGGPSLNLFSLEEAPVELQSHNSSLNPVFMCSLAGEWKQSHFFDALHPVLNVFEGLLIRDVVHQDDALAQSKDRDKEREDLRSQ